MIIIIFFHETAQPALFGGCPTMRPGSDFSPISSKPNSHIKQIDPLIDGYYHYYDCYFYNGIISKKMNIEYFYAEKREGEGTENGQIM